MNWGSSPARILAHDRRKAAIHEAGHYVIGRHFGLKSGDAWIAPTGVDPRGGEKTWIGQHRVRHEELNRLSEIRCMMIAVAGFVAEQRWEEAVSNPDNFFPDDFGDALSEPEAMSRSDWSMAGHLPGEPTRKLVRAAERVEQLLAPGAPLWTELLRTARLLIRRGGLVLNQDGTSAWKGEIWEVLQLARLAD